MRSALAVAAVPFRWLRSKAWTAVEFALWPRERTALWRARRAERAAEEQRGCRARDGP